MNLEKAEEINKITNRIRDYQFNIKELERPEKLYICSTGILFEIDTGAKNVLRNYYDSLSQQLYDELDKI
jgi:hypothetical protein